MAAAIATHPVACSFNMVVISGSPWRISRASRPERFRFIGASDRPLVSAACDSAPKNSRPRTGKYGESTCASRQACCRTRSCLPQTLRDRQLARRDLGGRRAGHAGRIRHSIARLREGSLARRPAVVFARTGIGRSEVRSPPCGRQDSSEQHPDHEVLRGGVRSKDSGPEPDLGSANRRL